MGANMKQYLTEKEKRAHQCIGKLIACLKEDRTRDSEFFDLSAEFFALKSDSEISSKFNEIAASYGLTPEIQAKIKMLQTVRNSVNEADRNYFYMVEKAEEKAISAKEMAHLQKITLTINNNPYEIYKNLKAAKKAIEVGLINADANVNNPLTGKICQRHECMLDIASDNTINVEKLNTRKDANDEQVFKILVYISKLPPEKQEALMKQIKNERPEIHQQMTEVMQLVSSQNFASTLLGMPIEDTRFADKNNFWNLIQQHVDTKDVNIDMIYHTFDERIHIQHQMIELYHVSKGNAEFNQHMIRHQRRPLSKEARANLEQASAMDIANAKALGHALLMFSNGKENESMIILLSWKNLETPEKRKSLLEHFQKVDPENYPSTLLLMYQALTKERKQNKAPLINNEYERSIPVEAFLDCLTDPRGKFSEKQKLILLIQQNDPSMYQQLKEQITQTNPTLSKQLHMTNPVATETLNLAGQPLTVTEQPYVPQTRVVR